LEYIVEELRLLMRQIEKIMSKTKDTSNLDHGTLADSELDVMIGGAGKAFDLIDYEYGSAGGGNVGGGGGGNSAGAAISAWNTLLKNYGYT
jgi:hypothetical protein